MRILTRLAVLAGLPLALLAGCGSKHDATSSITAPSSVDKKAASPRDPLALSLVAAVAATKAGTPPIPVDVKFALKEHPQAGEPAELELELIPTVGTLDRIFGKVRGEEGITIVTGADVPPADKPLENVPVHQSVTVLAAKDGIYELMVDLSVDSGGIVSTQSFSIPVVAGSGLADLGATGTVSAPTVSGKPATPAPAH